MKATFLERLGRRYGFNDAFW